MAGSDVIRMERIWAQSPAWETLDDHPELVQYVKYFLGILLREPNHQGDGWDAAGISDALRLMNASITDAREADLGMVVAVELELLTPTPHPTSPDRSVWVPTRTAWRLRNEVLKERRAQVERNGGKYIEDDYLGPPSPMPEKFQGELA